MVGAGFLGLPWKNLPPNPKSYPKMYHLAQNQGTLKTHSSAIPWPSKLSLLDSQRPRDAGEPVLLTHLGSPPDLCFCQP